MLFREDLGGRHNHPLIAGGYRREQCVRGNHRLAAPDISLQQPAHRHIPVGVRENRLDRAVLGGRHREGKRTDKPVT